MRESLQKRGEALAALSSKHYDLLVIGGGITGAGIAQDAASRGMQVALVERSDFASGTSSRSSKLIHGGLRYLAQGDFRVTYESCAERALLARLAPHLVQPRDFLVPVYSWSYGVQLVMGLWLYDIISSKQKSPFHKRINLNEVVRLAPMIKQDGLLVGYLYHDCKTNDARLLIEVLKSAVRHGATVANYVEVTDLIKHDGRICGATAKDLVTGELLKIEALSVVNATGVWMDRLRRIDDSEAETRIRPAKGAHILIARDRIPTLNVAMLFASGADDGRSLFFIPWYEGTIIGTTDTEYTGDIDSPAASDEDIEYILRAVRNIFPAANLKRSDILSSYAGLRPLINEGGKSTKDISREHKIFESDSGLLSIAGGKYTTYRRMARDAVDKVVEQLRLMQPGIELDDCHTETIYLSGIDPERGLEPLRAEIAQRAKGYGLPHEVATHLVEDYGRGAETVLDILAQAPECSSLITPGLPFIQAEVLYAIRHEQAVYLEDLLVRRTRIALLTPDQGLEASRTVANMFASELGWSDEKTASELERYHLYTQTQYNPHRNSSS